MAFPSFVGHSGALVGSTTTETVAPNASHASGDYEILIVESNSDDPDPTLSTAAGFTAHPAGSVVAAGATTLGVQLTAFERIWNGTDGSPTIADAGNHVSGVIYSFRRSTGTWANLAAARSATQNVGWATSSETTEDTTGVFPDLSSAEATDLLICGFTTHAKPDIAGGTAELSAITNANLGSITERYDDATNVGDGGWHGAFTGTKTGGGAPGTTSYTKATTSYKAHLVIALRDSAPSSPQTITATAAVAMTLAAVAPTRIDQRVAPAAVAMTLAAVAPSRIDQQVQPPALGMTLTPVAPQVFVPFSKSNSAEGGTDGVTVTPANSGGASGDAWGTVTGPVVFDDDHPADGGLGYKMQHAASENIALQFPDFPTSERTLWSRFYLYTDAFPSSSVIIYFLGFGSSRAADVRLTSSGTLQILDSGAVIRGTSSALSVSTMYRLELKFFSDDTTGSLELRIYAGHSETPLETVSASNIDTQNVNGIGTTRPIWGAGTVSGFTVFFDEIAVSNVDWIGPAGADTPTISPAAIAMTLVPVAPSRIDQQIVPASLSMTLAAVEPARVSLSVAPPAIAMTLAAVAPTIRESVSPGVVSMTLTPVAPTRIDQRIVPGAVAMTLSPVAPSLTQGAPTIFPAALAITLTPVAPSQISQQIRIGVSDIYGEELGAPVSMTLTPVAPASVSLRISPAPVAMTLSPVAPTLPVRVSLGTLSMTFAPVAPAQLRQQVNVSALSMLLSVVAPTVSTATPQTVTILAPVTMGMTAFAPTLLGGVQPRVHRARRGHPMRRWRT